MNGQVTGTQPLHGRSSVRSSQGGSDSTAGPGLTTLPGRRDGAASGESRLEALTHARSRYARISRAFRRPLSGPSLSVAVLLAAMAGVALALALPSHGTVVATFGFVGDPSPERRTGMRLELLDFAVREMGVGGSGAPAAVWFVDQSPDQTLRLGLNVSDGKAGIIQTREMAERFLEAVRRSAAETRTTPSVAEVVLGERATALAQMRDDIRNELGNTESSDGTEVDAEEFKELMRRWETLRFAYTAARQSLSEAAAELERLHMAGQPTYALVPAERRQAALREDAGLQQDLRELEVNLTEIKARILGVWQEASPLLERMAFDADELMAETADSGYPAPDTASTPRRALHEGAREYRDKLVAFGSHWTATFTAIRRLTPDPYTAELLNRYDTLRRSVNDFLYESAELYTRMRSALQDMDADADDTAAHYVSHSNLVRLFHKVQNTHHQFEFAAAGLETSNSFRLDAALQAARGLTRRSQHRIREIERELADEAIKEARRVRTTRLDQADQRVKVAREEADRIVDNVIALQEELNAGALRTVESLRRQALKQVSAARLDFVEGELARTDERIGALAKKRIAGTDQDQLELISCQELEAADDWAGRARIAGLGAAVTFLAVLLGQWWAFRRT